MSTGQARTPAVPEERALKSYLATKGLLERRRFEFFSAILFIRNQIAGEDLQKTFSCADNGSYIETNVNSAGDKSLLLYLIACQAKRED